jgi:hypothetical protein
MRGLFVDSIFNTHIVQIIVSTLGCFLKKLIARGKGPRHYYILGGENVNNSV